MVQHKPDKLFQILTAVLEKHFPDRDTDRARHDLWHAIQRHVIQLGVQPTGVALSAEDIRKMDPEAHEAIRRRSTW